MFRMIAKGTVATHNMYNVIRSVSVSICNPFTANLDVLVACLSLYLVFSYSFTPGILKLLLFFVSLWLPSLCRVLSHISICVCMCPFVYKMCLFLKLDTICYTNSEIHSVTYCKHFNFITRFKEQTENIVYFSY